MLFLSFFLNVIFYNKLFQYFLEQVFVKKRQKSKSAITENVVILCRNSLFINIAQRRDDFYILLHNTGLPIPGHVLCDFIPGRLDIPCADSHKFELHNNAWGDDAHRDLQITYVQVNNVSQSERGHKNKALRLINAHICFVFV